MKSIWPIRLLFLGLCIVGGLVVSQVITLYITPVIFLELEAFQEKVLDRIPFFRRTSLHDDAPKAPAALAPGRVAEQPLLGLTVTRAGDNLAVNGVPIPSSREVGAATAGLLHVKPASPSK